MFGNNVDKYIFKWFELLNDVTKLPYDKTILCLWHSYILEDVMKDP
jgi:hypothetical protein